ncbi:MAG: sulfotransferase [Arenicella sp.]|nr:sulfotransferase [Arenicella sp.]
MRVNTHSGELVHYVGAKSSANYAQYRAYTDGKETVQKQTSSSLRLISGLRKIASKQFEQVHAQAIEMIQANVNDPVAYCLLATIAAEYGNHAKAVELFERAAEIEPQNAYFQAYLGQALTTIGSQREAKSTADKAALLINSDAYLADTIGVIYSRTGFHEDAIPFFEKAVKLNPKPANFHYNLGASQQFLGHFERAEKAYFETLSRDSRAYRAWSSIVGLKRQTPDQNYLPELISLFESLPNDEDASLHLGHAIAKTMEDLGRYEDSFLWLQKAKRLKLKSTNSTTFSYDRLFEAAKSAATGAMIATDIDSERAPIFIIGLPRTGTTLVDRIISSHSDVTAAGELNVFPSLIKKMAKTASNMVMDADTFIASNTFSHEALARIGRDYIEAATELSRGTERFTDKMPLNFFYAGLILKALPNSRIIALRRGAMDSCLSNYRQLLTVQHSYYHYTYDLGEIAKFYRQFDQLMSHWRVYLPANRFIEVTYEDIVHDQESQTRRLLEFCGLEWQQSCMRFHENKAPVSTASSVQVRQPLYSGSIGRWQRYGDKLDGLKQTLGELAN